MCVAHLSQITLYIHFLLVREKNEKAGTEEGERGSFPLLMKLDHLAKIKEGMSWL